MKNLIVLVICTFSLNLLSQQLEPGILLRDPSKTEDAYTTAVRHYDHIISAEPNNVEAILLRSHLYKALNKHGESYADLELALSINPSATLYVDEGERNAFIEKRKYNFSGNGDSFSKSFLLEDEYETAINSGDITEEQKVLLEQAIVDIQDNNFDMALENIEQLPDDMNNALLYDLRGVIAIENDNLLDAVDYLTKAIAIDPEFTIAYHNRAVAYKMLGAYKESEADFKSALIQRSDIAKIRFGKAKLYELKGDMKNAEYYYKTAADSDEYYNEARLNYSIMLKSAGEYTKALVEANQLIYDFPDNAENYYLRGGLHFIYGEYSNAVDDFSRYLETYPEDNTVLFYKGLSRVLDGNTVFGCMDMETSIDNGNTTHAEVFIHMCE